LKKSPIIVSFFLKANMHVLSVFVSPCVLAPLPVKDVGADSSIENDVTNTLVCFGLGQGTKLISKISHNVWLSALE
jgi:hypothetical protein